MRALCAAVLATTLVASNAFAAAGSVAPLPTGKPAGVKEAALLGPSGALLLVGAGILVGGIALSVSGGDNKGVTTPTTTATSTAGLP